MAEAVGRGPLGDERGDWSSPAVALTERPDHGRIGLRGDPDDAAFLAAVSGVLGAALPTEPNTMTVAEPHCAMWLGPDEWQIVTTLADKDDLLGRITAETAAQHSSVVDLSDAQAILRLAGPASPDVLAKGCPLQLSTALGRGQCARTYLAKASVLLQWSGQSEEPAFDVHVAASFARYLHDWLTDAALEYSGRPPG